MSHKDLPYVICSRDKAQLERVWTLLRTAYVSGSPDVSIERIVTETAGRPVNYRYQSYAGSRVSHINGLLASKKSRYRIKPGTARGTYAIVNTAPSL